MEEAYLGSAYHVSKSPEVMVAMKKIVKAISALLAAVFICTVLISCSSEIRPIEASEQDKKVVGTCDGRKVLYDELRYITLSYRYDMEQAYMDEFDLDATLSAGKKTKGFVFFEVPKDAEKIFLEYETNFWTEDKIIFVVK